MKPKRNLLILAARALVYTCVTSSANAANGTWTSNADANWNAATTAPWAGGIVADGADATADFSTIDITAARTVTMTEDRTIGNLKFDDTGTSGDSNWTLLRSGATPTLTLQTSSGSPTITVTNTATFGSSTNGFVLAGANGFTKSGAGTLVFALPAFRDAWAPLRRRSRSARARPSTTIRAAP